MDYSLVDDLVDPKAGLLADSWEVPKAASSAVQMADLKA